MRKFVAVSSLALVAAAPPPSADAKLRAIVAPVSAAQLRANVEKLVSFGTRHTLSSQTDPKRGIGAALEWSRGEFQRYSAACGNCLTIVDPSEMMSNARVPTPTRIRDMVAIQRGTERPNDVVIIQGHIDSRLTDIMNFTSDAPGANDDGSGTAAVIEAARVLSKHKFPATLVFAVLAGEEQGLYGGHVLANYATKQGWRVEADLNNDIVGNSEGINGVRETTRVRVFSEGTKTVETAAEADKRCYNGGEVDSPSRQIARYMEGLAGTYLGNFKVTMVYRTDRFGRGGDQVEMLKAGFPSVR